MTALCAMAVLSLAVQPSVYVIKIGTLPIGLETANKDTKIWMINENILCLLALLYYLLIPAEHLFLLL
ncbi:hypothetical protein B4144_3557 [Bacillus atrophaeus]|nr:hypothetical protein B4144_3557 [Bacillus atrophaeus]